MGKNYDALHYIRDQLSGYDVKLISAAQRLFNIEDQCKEAQGCVIDSVVLFLLFKNNVTIIIYNICFAVFTALLTVTREIRLFNISDSKIIDKRDQCEFFALREGILNFGRVVGYVILLLAGISNNVLILNISLVLLTLSIFITGIYCRRINKFEK